MHILPWIFCCALGLGFVGACTPSQRNAALGKRYTLRPLPNYQLTAPANDSTLLTDGHYTPGHFWTKKTTVGWHSSGIVEILFDLGDVISVGGIRFGTARGRESDVFYPAHIYAFAGADLIHLSLIGDGAKNQENVPGGYQKKQFELQFSAIACRYFLLEVVPSGEYLFCDEVEILEAPAQGSQVGSLTVQEARTLARDCRKKEATNAILLTLVDSLEASQTKNQAIVGRLSNLRRVILSDDRPLGAERGLLPELLAVRADLLRMKYSGKGLLVEKCSPWAPLSAVALRPRGFCDSLALLLPRGGYAAAGILLTNLNDTTLECQVNVMGSSGSPELQVDEALFVETATREFIPDPLMPLMGKLTLLPGESRLLFVGTTAEIAGIWRESLRISTRDTTVLVNTFVRVYPTQIPKDLTLGTINWGYLDFKVLKMHPAEAVGDLRKHHINVVVVPPAYLPLWGLGEPKNALRLATYLRLHEGFSKALLYLEMRSYDQLTVGQKFTFMDTNWKEWFKSWYMTAVQIAATAGFPEERVYLYPFDEMRGEEIVQFVQLASWARDSIPGIKFYATIANRDALAALPYLDIAQFGDRPELLETANRAKGSAWFYFGTNKASQPYGNTRLVPWMAFIHGFSGTGFWNYADIGEGEDAGSAWDDLDGRHPDYAMIYEGQDGAIFSSRRWEAWRVGVEDFELLTMLAKAKGLDAARAIAARVLARPDDPNLADDARKEVLDQLSCER